MSNKSYYVINNGKGAGIYSSKVDFDEALSRNPNAEIAIFRDLRSATAHFKAVKSPIPIKPAKAESSKPVASPVPPKATHPVAESSKPATTTPKTTAAKKVTVVVPSSATKYETATPAGAHAAPSAYARGGDVVVISDDEPVSPLAAKLGQVKIDDTPFAFDGIQAPIAGTKTYYAVKVGKKGPGIYTKWMGAGECYENTCGFKNAIYKKFGNFEEARAFIRPAKTVEGCKSVVRIYTDGSFVEPHAGYGGIIVFPTGGTCTYKGKCPADTSNQYAELHAILNGFVQLAPVVAHCDGVKVITDSFYSMQMMSLPLEQHHAHQELITSIKAKVAEIEKYGKVVEFTHINSHQKNFELGSDAAYNDIADGLANEGRLGK